MTTDEKKQMNTYIKQVHEDCELLNNLLKRLKTEKEIKLSPYELVVVMRFSSLFDKLFIKVEDGILKILGK